MPRFSLPALALAACLTGPIQAQAQAQQEPAPQIAERLHVIYDPVRREVSRAMVRVMDPHPDLGLAFKWEPSEGNWPGIDAAGFATGPGIVTWRIEGLAAYDPRAVHTKFEGTLKAGVFDGSGTLRFRDGSEWAGHWTGGVLSGEGHHRKADGTLYEGAFVNGIPDGRGVWQGTDGTSYSGGFKAGHRHGAGQITEPGGLSYSVRYDMGQLVDSERPDTADPLVGGLLPAQSGDAASDVTMSLAIDGRVTEGLELQYGNSSQDGTIFFFPRGNEIQAMWNGSGWVSDFEYTLDSTGEMDWDETRAFVLLDMATRGGNRVRLTDLKLNVARSVPHLQPMPKVESHGGCVGFRPSFSIRNYGWGAIEGGTLSARFVNPNFYDQNVAKGDEPGTGFYDLNLPAFDEGSDIWVTDILQRAGVDIARLQTERFTCPSYDQLDACRARIIEDVDFGELQPVVDGWASIGARLQGKMSYNWTDAFGNAQTSVQGIEASINLLRIEFDGGLAECAGAGAFGAESPEYHHIELPYSAADYSVDIPVRGNPNISRLVQGLALWSDRSSWHEMQVEAVFGDGSVRKSAPLQLFFMHPRQPDFESNTRPAQCYLPVEMGSC